ncbi:MAG: glucose-1-phosphate adenylyltransferase subunit GlgD [Gemmiger sp.]|uniref:glucose-1-phosphate adenylyltransferase subunit GlgD n=1 Tax=Gemmiger sp. TaxID=2049027 RepID=UPI002A81E460|nr:glucose-1-phosphate adenylyltransferase subunit GlgD [Gemmiger sp.]MCI6883918.1 glucose-1-phosphate adenylyltransferase subunit GlgD [bacterium]MDY4880607.1 glucose-1-phosphate adenylyltransferase subunit GlgD [Gemmiger sp.]
MVSSNANALGVIFANSYDNLVPELVAERTMGSIPFAGRYRMIDFVLSNMANAGIDNVSVIVRKNYHSLMDHLGSGREWDLTRKRGGLNIVPPFAERSVKLYSGRVDALASVLSWLQAQKERYVILSDTNVAMNFDFNKLIDAHVASGADVTMVYNRSEIPDGARNDNYTIRIDNGRVTELLSNDYRPGVQNLSLNLYIIERETLIQLIRDAAVRGLVYFERDILARNLNLLNVQAYEFDGYAARIADMKSYFDENMRLLEPGNVDKLFDPANPIYTKIRDDNPTRYLEGSKVKNSLLADGCVIEGTVENSVLFRGCQIKKGAVIKNCVLMQDTVVEEGCTVEYVVSDKNVHITSGKQLTGTDSFPVFVAKGHTV